MLRVGGGDALGLLLPLGQGLFIDIEFHGREGLEKRIHYPSIDRIGRNILTHRGPVLLSVVVTDVAGAPLIPTVCLDATSFVLVSYGCDDGRIGPTRCAVIGAGRGDR